MIVHAQPMAFARCSDDGRDCLRCFRMERRSRNVIEVFSEAVNRCYTSVPVALASCDTLNSASILYRK